MGLDMYLVGHHYNTAYVDDVPRPMLDDKYHIESMTIDLGYWRKHADLHGYIINTYRIHRCVLGYIFCSYD